MKSKLKFFSKLGKKRKKQIKTALKITALFLISYSLYIYFTLPDCSSLKATNPKLSLLMQNRQNSAREQNKKYSINHKWVNLASVSQDLVRAVLTAEDSTFFWHDGIEFVEWRFALYDAITRFEFPRGASTVTQQLAKNLYLANDWAINRKIKEIFVAKQLERALSKKRILELYLNFIEWGEGIFGVEAAAQHYFQKPASALGRDESAFLAAIIPSPLGIFNPQKYPKRVKERAELILFRMDKIIVLK